MYPLWSINDVMLSRNRRQVASAIREFTGRKYDYTPRNAFEERYVHYVSTIEAERIRNQVTLTALKGLIIKLGGLREGRKAIVLISEGFTNSLPAQMNDQVATCNGMRVRQPAAAASRRCRRRNPPMQQRHGVAGVFPAGRSDVGLEDGLRAGESLQHRDLCRRSRAASRRSSST